ncbi:hypothetical protein Hanom_Chr16g01437191 [Helianthus anomalus]
MVGQEGRFIAWRRNLLTKHARKSFRVVPQNPLKIKVKYEGLKEAEIFNQIN